ncbi:hypothetical protein VZH09_12815 [Synechococcus elongatus IITB7]|uniref:hypothetical protein n=1 Tax=Synechococcus elongatus TaxID=32046 RepID=UPI0030CC7201
MSFGQPSRSPFCAGQIVQCQRSLLWLLAEVIDVVSDRDRLWLRPLAVAVSQAESWQVFDCREDSQLLVPLSAFEAAEDVAAITLLSQLSETPQASQAGRQHLRSLLRQLLVTAV